MEVRVEAVEGQLASLDTFVSLRIGDTQKQTRFHGSRTFRFPEPGKEGPSLGRIEVFQRIAHMNVVLSSFEGGELQNLDVPCILPGVEHLQMKMSLKGAPAAEKSPEDKSNQNKAKFETAKKYLADYHLEEVLADAIREVVHLKPENPFAFLSAELLKNELIPKKKSTPPAAESAPAKVPSVPAAKLQDFTKYYQENFKSLDPSSLSGLYAKFPSQRQKAESKAPAASAAPAPAPAKVNKCFGCIDFTEYYQKHFKSLEPAALSSLYSKFPVKKVTTTAPAPAPAPAPAAVAPKVSFNLLASVGTWLAPRTFQIQGALATPAIFIATPKQAKAATVAAEKPAATKTEATVKAPEVPFALKPSVASWLAPRPFQVPIESKPASAPPTQAAAPKAAPVKLVREPFNLLPSVGSWLAPAPLKKASASKETKSPEIAAIESKVATMAKEEIVTAFEAVIEAKDHEIEELKKQLAALKG